MLTMIGDNLPGGLRQCAAIRAASALALLLCLIPCAQAQESNFRYVNDVIHINLRVAPARDAETILVIPSGTRMVVLARDDERDFRACASSPARRAGCSTSS
jgi:hypothetical protein